MSDDFAERAWLARRRRDLEAEARMLDEKVTGVQRAIDDWIRPSTRASTRVDLKDLARLLDMLAAVDPAYGRSLAPQDVLDHFAAGHISDGDCGAIEDGVLRDTRRRIEDIWDQL